MQITEMNLEHLQERRPIHLQIHTENNGFSVPKQDGDKSSAFLQNLIDACMSNIAILDSDRTILFVNRAWRQFASLTGVSGGQSYVGKKYPDVSLAAAACGNLDTVAIARGINSIVEKKEIDFQIECLCTAVTEPLWFRIHASSFSFPETDGRTLIIVSHDDVTNERLTRDLFETDRQRIDRLLHSTKILPWEVEASTGAIKYIGDQAEKMFGYERREWFEPNFWIDHLHPDDKQRAAAEFACALQGTRERQHEYRMIAKDGRVVWINDIMTVESDNGGPTTISGYMIDITDRKSSDETLLMLSGRLITAQEDERKRIARELHDDLNQRMALMSIELEQMGQMLPNNTDGVSERVKELQRKAMRISQEIHRMSYKLHPSKLDHLGLVPALRSFCSEISERRKMRITFHHEGAFASLSADITLCLFRIAQEALQNAAKHSGAREVNVALEIIDTEAKLKVSDNGCGFDMNNGRINEGLGFISMRERLRLLNGSLRIQSNPFIGTQIIVSVPLVEGVR